MARQNGSRLRDVYIVDGARSPFLKATGPRNAFSAADISVAVCKPLLLRNDFPTTALDEVITGCMMPSEDEANVARVIALRLGYGQDIPAWTVQRNCASGMQALDNAAVNIAQGRSDLVLAGGVDVMSHAPVLYNAAMANWLAQMMNARSFPAKLKALARFRPHMLKPVISLLRGLTDHTVGLSMGQTAENLAYRFEISRRKMDEFASESHQRVLQAVAEGWLDEITPIFDKQGNVYQRDTGVREDSTVARLAKLKPFFDKKYGAVTAGNSSQITDGAAYLLLASAEAVKTYGLTPRARLLDTQWAALDPAHMGLGPVFASTPLLKRNKLRLKDIDYWEINEAFATQVLACIAAWEDQTFCREELGLKQAFGSLDQSKLNIDGGAIAVGHPIGASGARIVLHLLNVLERQQARRGVASICVGGGQGGAMLIERMS